MNNTKQVPLFQTVRKLSIALGLLILPHLLQANTATVNQVDFHRVITAKTKEISAIHKKPFDNLSLVSKKDGVIEAIPFQFDEMAENDYVHIEDTNTTLLGEAGILDENDELLFMYRDAGEKIKAKEITDGKYVSELQINLHDKESRYVYIVENARVISEDYYVRYSSKLGRTESDYYYLEVNRKNAYMWSDFAYSAFEGVGPIRATTTFKATLTYLKLPIFNTELQVRHYEGKVVYDAIFKIPTLRRKTLANALIRLSIDGYNLEGGEAAFAHVPTATFPIDGAMNTAEGSLSAVELSEDDLLWTWINTDQKFIMASIYKFEQIGASKKHKAVVLPWYEDIRDKHVKPEYFKGQTPNLGYSIELPSKGKMRLRSSHNMFSDLSSRSATEAIADIKAGYEIISP
jgi:hypothetical protein